MWTKWPTMGPTGFDQAIPHIFVISVFYIVTLLGDIHVWVVTIFLLAINLPNPTLLYPGLGPAVKADGILVIRSS